jgi:excinuclease ABC subunit C
MVETATLPRDPGCYLFRDDTETILYIGKAKDIRKRVTSYFQRDNPDPRIRAMVGKVASVDFMATDTEAEALLLENTLIKRHQPHYNIDLKDAKSFAYIMLTREEFPRIGISRRPSEEASFFGPFVSARDRDRVLRVVRKAFGLRTCRRLPKRACLRRQMGSCTAPCTGDISAADYGERVKRVEAILKGQSAEILRELRAGMGERSRRKEFEQAMALRDQIQAVEHLSTRQKVEHPRGRDQDILSWVVAEGKVHLMVFSVLRGTLSEKEEFIFPAGPDFPEEFLVQYYGEKTPPAEVVLPEPIEEPLREFLSRRRGSSVQVTIPERGEKRKLLDLVQKNLEHTFFAGKLRLSALQEALDLPSLPSVIECFDISHLSGTATVGSMVRFTDGRPDKKNYRRFRIRTVGGIDDPAAIAEVVRRRYSRLVQEHAPFPDLVIIDGGRAQLTAAWKAIADLGLAIPVISIAKPEDEIHLPGRLSPLPLGKKDPASLLVRAIRDEAHRFAVAYHHLLRRKQVRAKA